jgi:hypothetical protein
VRRGNEADGDQARLNEGVGRHVGLQAAPPGVKGSGGNALAFAEMGESQATLAEAIKALLPAVMSGGVRASAGRDADEDMAGAPRIRTSLQPNRPVKDVIGRTSTVTEVYAEIDAAKATEVMEKLG